MAAWPRATAWRVIRRTKRETIRLAIVKLEELEVELLRENDGEDEDKDVENKLKKTSSGDQNLK
jgi:hypothetical protein